MRTLASPELDGIIGDYQKGSLGPSDRSVPYDTVCQMVGTMERA